MRKVLKVAMWLGLLCLVLGVGSLFFVDKWLFVVLNPGVFDPSKTPKALDYQMPGAWAALPSRKDGADVSLPSHPAISPSKAPADVFYLHPTTMIGPHWNASPERREVQRNTHRGALLIQASVFNACCRVYAPYYRQAHGRAFVKPNVHGDKAIAIAYRDAKAAFRYFLKHYNEKRPFILAAHSQGAVLAARLLKEEIVGKPIAKRMVVAYLPGAPVTLSTWRGRLPVCKSPTQLRCVVAWNARGPKYRPNVLEFGYPGTTKGRELLRKRICVNPLTWKQNANSAPPSRHLGAIFFDAKKPKIISSFAGAKCKDGQLVVTQMKQPYRDTMSKILDWIMGPQNYHPIEYQLFYLNIRQNAGRRVQAYQLQRQPTK